LRRAHCTSVSLRHAIGNLQKTGHGGYLTLSDQVFGKDLYYQREDRPKDVLIPEATDIFFRKGAEGRRLFRYAENGKVDALIDRRNNEDLIWTKIPGEK